jgi:hypothetical protein
MNIRSIAAVLTLILAGQALADPIAPGAVRVIDGDTIEAQGRHVRLVGFDAPESGFNAKCESEHALCPSKPAQRAGNGPKETKIGEVLKKAQSETGVFVPEIHSLTGWKKMGGFFTAAKRANLTLNKKRENEVTTYFASKAA